MIAACLLSEGCEIRLGDVYCNGRNERGGRSGDMKHLEGICLMDSCTTTAEGSTTSRARIDGVVTVGLSYTKQCSAGEENGNQIQLHESKWFSGRNYVLVDCLDLLGLCGLLC